ncbi:MAG: hypothetical protein IT434_09585 [Phycisphaerales bacterium]|nr:hypothetical protein [Phycisphaerales bacterium]
MIICSFTDFDDVRLTVDGQVFRFEFSKRFGPLMIGKRGRTIDNYPPLKSPFWDALQAWCTQGHQVVNGEAVYLPEPEPTCVRLIGRQYVEVPAGRNPEDVRREWLAKVFKDDPVKLEAALRVSEGP